MRVLPFPRPEPSVATAAQPRGTLDVEIISEVLGNARARAEVIEDQRRQRAAGEARHTEEERARTLAEERAHAHVEALHADTMLRTSRTQSRSLLWFGGGLALGLVVALAAMQERSRHHGSHKAHSHR
jgi:coproporphyrinogen III oxidase